MKTNIFKYLKFLSITAFSLAVMFTAAFGACAAPVNVGGQGMTSVGSLTGVSTNLTEPSSAVNVGTLGNATRQEVRFLAVPFASTENWKKNYYPNENLTNRPVKLYQEHDAVCKTLDNTIFSLGITKQELYASWAPLTIEAAIALHNFITIPPLYELNRGTSNNLTWEGAANYNTTNPLFMPGPSGAFGLAAQYSTHNYQQYWREQDRYDLNKAKHITNAKSLGKIGGAYPQGNKTVAENRGADWFPLCYTKEIKNKSGDKLVDFGTYQNAVPLYWYPTLQ
jgi:hypothetical protein